MATPQQPAFKPGQFKMKIPSAPGGGAPSSGGAGLDKAREWVNEHKIESLCIAVAGAFLFAAYLVVSGA
ncbi:MAG: hypothetical protein GX606_01450, partial [Elusimicrobia bacterium]|nr:hypothetical protein [Elusimicrobiota bacterium]